MKNITVLISMEVTIYESFSFPFIKAGINAGIKAAFEDDIEVTNINSISITS